MTKVRGGRGLGRGHSGRRLGRRAGWSALAALALVVCGAAPAASQGGIRLLPQAGLAAPQSAFGEVRNGGATLIEAGRRSSSLALGLGVEVGNPREGTSVRAHLVHATNASIPVGGFECDGCSVRSSVSAATLAAVFRPIPPLILVQPHFVIGAGVKRYDFEPRNVQGEAWRSILRDQTQFTVQAGVGTSLSLLGFRPEIELGGWFSDFSAGDSAAGEGRTRMQTDLFLMLSLPLGG